MEIDDGNLCKKNIIELLQEYTVCFVGYIRRKLWNFMRKRVMTGINCIRRKYRIFYKKKQLMLS